jgi:hypothetical protein
MRTKDLIDLADNPNFISGIYNYCDRWCERCPFTSRCLVYATENEDQNDDPDSRDIRNAAFWEKLRSIFTQTREMIVAWAKESGVDLSTIDTDAIVEQDNRAVEDARSDDLAVAAENYAWQVNDWFEEERTMESSDDSGASTDTADENGSEDATEVIRWYQFQIAAKTVRALMSRENETAIEEGEINTRDSDGSAKVALIAMDRSISAWRIMQLSLPDKADSIIPLLVTLERLRQYVEQTFPNARDFIRPGFDEAAPDVVQ